MSTVQTARDINKLRDADRAVHDWYRFVLSYPPHFVRSYLGKFNLDTDSVVLDPFCGTGTTLVECKKSKIPSVGVEANPMARFASVVKVNWSVDPRKLRNHAAKIARLVEEKFERQGLSHDRALPLFRTTDEPVPPELRRLPRDKMKLLLADSISPLPLHRTLELLDAIKTRSDPKCNDHELLALAAALVSGIGNLRFGPEVGLGPKKEDCPVTRLWLDRVRGMSDDLEQWAAHDFIPCSVIEADSRRLSDQLAPESIDAVITSPPYPNEKDYTRTTRLESVLLGFIASKAELRALKKGLIRSNTRGVYKEDVDDQYVRRFGSIKRVVKEIETRRIQLGKTSGFERLYGRVALLYFGGMAMHLRSLREALRPGAVLAYVVGDQCSYLRVKIETGKILAEIADSLGYEVTGLDLFRTRMATATREQLREEVLLLKWNGQPGR